jgi:menaquinone-dependent protoporphyrinogen oxidase
VVDAKDHPPSPDAYDLVVVGSGISADRWTKEAAGYLKRHAAALKEKRTTLFARCRAGGDEELREQGRRDYPVGVAEKHGLSPVAYGLFGGLYDFTKSHGFLGNIMLNVAKKELREKGVDTSKPYDFRDWTQIEAWTREIAEG